MTAIAFAYQEQSERLLPDLGNLFPLFQHNRQKIYYTSDGMSVKNRLLEFIAFKEITPKIFEVTAELGNGFVNNAGDSIRRTSLEKISKAYPDLNTAWLLTGQGNMIEKSSRVNNSGEPYIAKPSQKPNAIEIGEVGQPDGESPFIEIGNNQYIMVVPLVPVKAQASYVENYQDERFIEDNFTQKHTFTVTRVYRGKYMAFIVDGESMDNGVAGEAIREGDIVTGREIKKDLWRSKFHMHRYKDYVIVHRDGIFVKRITQHDTENGVITCHSLNPDKEQYFDFDLKLDECLQILNIVNVTQTK